jgi:TRAP-type C4-dicarboxylate transport system substrate-binding protein
MANYGINEGYLGKVPFLFRSFEHMEEFNASPEGLALSKKLEDTVGIKILIQNIRFFTREFLSKPKPIIHVEDLASLKLRAGDSATTMTMKAFGAAPTAVSITEMYTALSNGMIDAVELPLDFIRDYSVYEIAKNLTLSHHMYEDNLVVINLKVYNSLSPEYQKILIDEGPIAVKLNNDEVDKMTGTIIEDLKSKGVKVYEINRDEWVAKLRSIIPVMEKEWPETKGLYDKILAL